jgi:CheY-like chemotaxis protein
MSLATMLPLTQIADRFLREWRARRDPQPHILVADDDEAIRTLCSTILTRAGYVVHTAENGREAVELLRRRRYAAILLDWGMPFLHGATVVAILRKTQPESLDRLIVITGASEAALADIKGARTILRKPVAAGRLVDAVEECCGKPHLSGTQTHPSR